ncbi:hypothetical protein [Streptomyces sp. PSKA30]|uniref:hypothetical protein n=1 Tax=Streptomyces sp. PSKA30 TaxID=2874597 RepID=UPI001CD15DC3|nr:hypothetical protein [Streptomyces sp. PSKA30]MBZ9640160.1 hypothetical protein [Streptomyces sp. PSKA30]
MRRKTTPTNAARTVQLLAAVVLFTTGTGALAGCGSEQSGGSGNKVRATGQAPEAAARARRVADAWDGSKAAEAWRAGYHPMGEAVELPEGGFHDKADEHAYATQNFVLRGRLPAAPERDGRVTWASGGSLARPMLGARDAYGRFARSSSEGPHLTVTGARLGEMTLATSRGPATVPAWLFTLEGYDTPLKSVAVGPSKLPKPPIGPAAGSPSGELWELRSLVEVAGDGRSVTAIGNHGACDDGPAVHVLETDGSVVLSASIAGRRDGLCTAQLLGREVTVKLDRPVGDRVLLDAATGRPVPYGGPHGPSPSWS